MATNETRTLDFLDAGIYTGGDRNRDNYIPNPSEYTVGEEDIDLNSKRGTNGKLRRNRIAVNKHIVKCSWDKLTEAQVIQLRLACMPAVYRLKFRYAELDYENKRVISPYTTCNEMYTQASREYKMKGMEDEEHANYSFSLEIIEC